MKKTVLLCLMSIFTFTTGMAQESSKRSLMVAAAGANSVVIEACIAKCGEQQTRCQEKSSSRSSSSAFGFIMGKVCETAYTKCENTCNNIGKPKSEQKKQAESSDEEEDF